MPNQLNSVLVTPGEVASGSAVQVTVKYDATTQHDLDVSCSGSFSVSPASVGLPVGLGGTVVFALTVTRTKDNAPHECMVHFIFDGDERRRVLEVT
jgi:hypothetical protein